LREHAGVGPKTFQQLVVSFGSPVAVLKSKAGEISSLPRMSSVKEEKIRAAGDQLHTISRRLSDYFDRGIRLVTVLDDDYPPSLHELDDPPPLFYSRGDLDALRRNCVAIVGSHEASSEGVAEAVRLGQEIASTGTVVVSGMARGIDSAAHVGAIQTDGGTAAVLGCGFDDIYPSENAMLAESICEHGVLVSEYRPETGVSTGRLLARNRIIVGLARSVIVVEVTSDSGGTAGAIREAHKQGKSLFTCFDPNQEGIRTNKLGAIHLAAVDDWKMVLRYMV
jgi:DNA processing protein